MINYRILKPSRPVIHAAHAYWDSVLMALKKGCAADELDAEQFIQTSSNSFVAMLNYVEVLRRGAPSIAALKVADRR
jgi:hypothetical protein